MIVWDERKREANLRKHGFDFADGHLVYDNPEKITLPTPRDGERREMDLAFVEAIGTVLSLVYVSRAEDIRAISFRRASRTERRLYERIRSEKQD